MGSSASVGHRRASRKELLHPQTGYLYVSIGRIRGSCPGSSEITVTAMFTAVITVQTIAVPITNFIIARERRLAVAISGKATATGTDYYAVALHCSHRLSRLDTASG